MTPDEERAHEALRAKLTVLREEGHRKLKLEMETELGHSVTDDQVNGEAVRRGLALFKGFMEERRDSEIADD